MSGVALEIVGLSIGYTSKRRSKVVASGIDATLAKGELVALLGRNGSGKSTLLRTLAAYNRALGGSVRYNGEDIISLTIEELAKKMSVVLTEQVVERAMEIMGVAELAGRDIYTLSDGEKQKCMIAKALAQQTPIIMLDEPTAYLDYPSKVGLMQMLKKVAATEGKAVIVSTHDLDIALRISDKIWLMNDGRLISGTVAELSSNGDLGSFINDDGVFYNEKENRIEIK